MHRLRGRRSLRTVHAALAAEAPLVSMKRKTLVILLLLAAALVGGAWHFRPTPAPAGAERGGRRGGGPGGAPTPVVLGSVEEKDVPIYLDGLGTVQAFNTVLVRPRVDGELQQVAFTEGQEVKKGDLLAVIDPRPLQAAADQAAAKKAQDEAQLANARLVLERNQDLVKKKVLDQQTYDASKYNVDQLQAGVLGDQAALENARTQLSYTRVTAPIDGRVGVRTVDQGNIVHAADAGGLVTITQLHPISVVFTLPEGSLQAVLARSRAPEGLKVTAMDRADVARLGEGTLAVIDNQIDQTTGTIRLKATFPNEDLKLWPGQFVNARLLLTTRKGGIVIPESVVQRGPQGTYAYVVKPDQTVEMRAIKVARSEDGVALIDEGLRAGEQVVVDGQYKLQPGAKVAARGAAPGTPRRGGAHPNGR